MLFLNKLNIKQQFNYEKLKKISRENLKKKLMEAYPLKPTLTKSFHNVITCWWTMGSQFLCEG